jgi:hypothetical protein
MDNDARMAAYRRQNGRLSLTARQYRQLDRMARRGRTWPTADAVCLCLCGGTRQVAFTDPATGAGGTMRCPECTAAGESLDPRVEATTDVVK